MTQQNQIESDCQHLWIIESPNGPTSQGTCKLCGQQGEFKNSMPVSGWDRAGAQPRRPKQASTQ